MKMQHTTAQVIFSLITFASLFVKVAAFVVCSPIDPKIIDMTKWVPLKTEPLMKDDFFNEMWMGYFGGEFKAQIVAYPFGGGNVMTLRHRVSATNWQKQNAYGRGVVAITVGDDISYFWLHSDDTCRCISPKGAQVGDVKTITIYSAN